MFAKKRQQRAEKLRHQQLLDAAKKLVDPFEQPASPADLVALAFGRHQMEVTEEEAARYLDAARVAQGDRLALPADVELPEPDSDEAPGPDADREAAAPDQAVAAS
jgi:hypothetical protein